MTLLRQLLDGTEPWQSLCIFDSITSKGHRFRNGLAQSCIDRGESVVVVAFDNPVPVLQRTITPPATSTAAHHSSSRISFVDAFSNSHGWQQPSTDVKSQTTAIAKCALGELSATLASLPQGAGVCLVLESMTQLLLHHGLQQVSHLIRAQSRLYGKILTLVHTDLHDAEILTALKWLFNTHSELQPFTAPNPRSCDVIHRRRTGKVLKENSAFNITPSSTIAIVTATPKSTVPDPVPSGCVLADPGADLTFNLKLTSAQEKARAMVPPPYLFTAAKQQQQLGGRIYYEPDAADDFDEEDPDDDLDI